jgi:hypothetical protein
MVESDPELGNWTADLSTIVRPCLVRGNPQGGEFSPHNYSSGEAARLKGFSVIRFGQWTTRNVPPIMPRCSERWREMRQHKILRSHPLCHRAKIGRHALAVKDGRRESASLVGAQDGVHRRVHNDISPLCQLLHLIAVTSLLASPPITTLPAGVSTR